MSDEHVFDLEARIQHLERELEESCRTVIHLMQEEARTLLRDFEDLDQLEDLDDWRERVAEKIVNLAIPLNDIHENRGTRQAICPLCGAGSESDSRQNKGFQLPTGLRMHLCGEMRARECHVMKAAVHLAKLHGEREVITRQRRRAHETELAKRRAVELVIVGGPARTELLNDEVLCLILFRTTTARIWAESRLSTLEYVLENEGRVVSYTRQHYIVYADTRYKKRITFALFRQQQNGEMAQPIASYEMFDHWTKNLKEKYESWVAKLVIGAPYRGCCGLDPSHRAEALDAASYEYGFATHPAEQMPSRPAPCLTERAEDRAHEKE